MKPSNHSKIFLAMLVSWLAVACGLDAMAYGRIFTATLYRISNIENEHDILPDEEGRRSLSKPTVCMISEEGIFIAGYETSEIIKYEIYDNSKVLLASFIDQKDFVKFIYTYCGEIIIRLVFENFALVGYTNSE